MKTRWLLILWACIALPNISNGQDACVKARRVIEQLNKLHIQPRAINDSLSADIFSEFFKTLDPYGELFISKDTDGLAAYRSKLDDGNETVCSFLRDATTLYRKKLEWYYKFTDSLTSQPFNFSKNEMGPTAIEAPLDFCKTDAELKNRIAKEIKLSVLLSIYRRASADSTVIAEPAARQRVRKNELVEIEKLLKDPKLLTTEVEDAYLKSIPAVFDPHSTYFGETEMKEFEEDLNPNELSFGIRVNETPTNEVKVSNVVPGSPAWNSNQINKDDVLIGIRWRTSGEYVDLIDLDAELIEEALDGKENSAEITIRKPTGELRNVKLAKEKLENEENIVSGFVLKGKASKRTVGYISLPGFFTDVNPELTGCAVAVTKEIIKLKGESIEGLILDLRYNGGGSLYEAMELAGLFIDVGPIAVVERTGEAPVVLKDMNRGLVYDGPLVIMVNGASASASEVVSAALQDYHRAIIAGSTTYGKATGQAVVPIDDKHPEEGFLKITEMRIYRINGKTHQGKGVTPDFPLSDFSSMFYTREEQNPHTLKPQTINKKTFYTPVTDYFSKALDLSIENRAKPVDSVQINELHKILTTGIPLEQRAFVSLMKKTESILKKINMGRETGSYSVSNSEYDRSTLNLDLYHKEINNEILKQVSTSPNIQEAFHLLDNVIAVKK
jgi:carboxyl-terminal processing protease